MFDSVQWKLTFRVILFVYLLVIVFGLFDEVYLFSFCVSSVCFFFWPRRRYLYSALSENDRSAAEVSPVVHMVVARCTNTTNLP